jgi:hypothetical protein
MNVKPLTYDLSRTSDPWSARQARQLSYLAEHTADIRHIAGEENVVADTLSRPTPLSGCLCKRALRVFGSRLAGRQARILFTSMVQSTVCAVSAIAQKLDFAAIAEHQKTCHATLQASKSCSLQLQAVEVMGVRLW